VKLFKSHRMVEAKWRRTGSFHVLPAQRKKELRPWQQRAFGELADSWNIIINSPTGSGKSLLVKVLAAHSMVKDQNLRTIISVPQTIIGSGFGADEIVVPRVGEVDWCPSQQLCEDNSEESKVEKLLGFLGAKPGQSVRGINSRIAVCSHAVLVMAFNSLSVESRKEAFGSTMVWFDEAHHIQNAECDLGVALRNEAGKMVDFLLGMGSRLGLVTATFFRGDQTNLLTAQQEGRFKRFNLPYDEYMQDMTYLKHLTLDFISCGQDFAPVVKRLFKEGTKDIVYVPTTTALNNSLSMSKIECTARVIEAYRSSFGGEAMPGPIFTDIVSGGKRLRIVDLVDDANREKKKAYINGIKDLPEEERRGALDVIVTMNMFKEGADWIYANRAIIIGFKGSLVDNVQIIGRLTRDVPGKEEVEIKQLIFAPPPTTKMELRERLNDHINAICLTMLMEDVFQPVRLRVASKPGSGRKEGLRRDWLAEALPDVDDRIWVMNQAMLAMTTIQASHPDECKTGAFFFGEFVKRLALMLREFKLEHRAEGVALGLWVQLLRKRIPLKRLEGFTYQQIIEANPLEDLVKWVANLNLKSLREVRQAWRLHDVSGNQRQLLLLSKGSERPPFLSKLGNVLCAYTTGKALDRWPEFNQKIREKQPQWFPDLTNRVEENMQALLSLSKGCERPSIRTKLGVALHTYTCKRTCHPKFNKLIRAKQPQWFWREGWSARQRAREAKREKGMKRERERIEDNKRRLLLLPPGSPKPAKGTILLNALNNYTRTKRRSMHAEFDKLIREKQPQWFMTGSKQARTFIEEFPNVPLLDYQAVLLSMPKGCPRPTKFTKLGRALRRYTHKERSARNQEFNRLIREKQPEWFEVSHQTIKVLARQSELLGMPTGASMPSKGTELGRSVRRYVGKKGRCQYPDFDRLIREKQPTWFCSSRWDGCHR
jgi:hypothetical protein